MTIDNENYDKVLTKIYNCDLRLSKIVDNVVFTVNGESICYKPNINFLSCISHRTNRTIFHKLGIDDPKEFCRNVCGHSVGTGDFPEARSEADFIAIVRALFNACINTKVPRIELSSISDKCYLDTLEIDIVNVYRTNLTTSAIKAQQPNLIVQDELADPFEPVEHRPRRRVIHVLDEIF